MALALDFNALQQRGIDREDPLHTFAEGDLAHGEALIEPAAAARNADAFKALHTLALAFTDAHADDQRVTGGKFRNGFLAKNARGFFLFELLNEVHYVSPSRR